MSKQSIPREQIVGNNKRDVKVKQKRKNAHQVRKYFLPAGETKQKCTFCGWVTRENATRMVQHIVQRCNEASTAAREEISASVVDAEERELQSYYTSHNKKAVHDFFKSVDNDRKRQCVFCRWSTVLNLTRMRYHILQMCHYVPPEVRQSFLKQEYTDSDSQCDTYCIVNVDDGDRKGVTLVSSSSLEHSDGTLVEEVVIETEDFDADNQEEVDGYYETIIPDQLEEEDDLRDLNQLDNETEVEMVDCGNPIEEITLPSVQKNEDTRLINLSDRYYNVGKRRVSERSPRAANDHSGTKKTRTEAQELQNDKKLTRSAAVKVLPALNQPGSRDQPVRRFRTGTSTPNIVVKKETVMKPSPPQETDHQPMQKNEKQSESQTTPRQKTAAIARSSPQPKTPVAETSTSVRNTHLQIQADTRISSNTTKTDSAFSPSLAVLSGLQQTECLLEIIDRRF